MGRSPRLVGAQATYHLTARGNGKVDIFGDDADRIALLHLLRLVVSQRGWLVWAYCLMSNHIHLCITTPQPDLSRGMCDLLGAYARRFNARYGFVDHLFGRRFGDVHVTDDRQLITIIRYVARNPQRAGLVHEPDAWPWSSYSELLNNGTPAGVPLVNREHVLALFHRREGHAIPLMRQLVASEPPPTEHDLLRAQRPSPKSLAMALERQRFAAVARDRGVSTARIASTLGIPYAAAWRMLNESTARVCPE